MSHITNIINTDMEVNDDEEKGMKTTDEERCDALFYISNKYIFTVVATYGFAKEPRLWSVYFWLGMFNGL